MLETGIGSVPSLDLIQLEYSEEHFNEVGSGIIIKRISCESDRVKSVA